MTKAKSILSWNVNGIRAVLKKGFEDFLAETNHDIVCLQETKISEELLDEFIKLVQQNSKKLKNVFVKVN